MEYVLCHFPTLVELHGAMLGDLWPNMAVVYDTSASSLIDFILNTGLLADDAITNLEEAQLAYCSLSAEIRGTESHSHSIQSQMQIRTFCMPYTILSSEKIRIMEDAGSLLLHANLCPNF